MSHDGVTGPTWAPPPRLWFSWTRPSPSRPAIPLWTAVLPGDTGTLAPGGGGAAEGPVIPWQGRGPLSMATAARCALLWAAVCAHGHGRVLTGVRGGVCATAAGLSCLQRPRGPHGPSQKKRVDLVRGCSGGACPLCRASHRSGWGGPLPLRGAPPVCRESRLRFPSSCPRPQPDPPPPAQCGAEGAHWSQAHMRTCRGLGALGQDCGLGRMFCTVLVQWDFGGR